MTHRHVPARTTHTVELEQIEQLNEQLKAPGSPRHPLHHDQPHDPLALTAEALGLAGETATVPHPQWSGDLTPAGSPHSQALPARAVLDHITADGPPSFPYIWGHFRPEPGRPDGDRMLLAPLHTEALIHLSAALGLRQRWGF